MQTSINNKVKVYDTPSVKVPCCAREQRCRLICGKGKYINAEGSWGHALVEDPNLVVTFQKVVEPKIVKIYELQLFTVAKMCFTVGLEHTSFTADKK